MLLVIQQSNFLQLVVLIDLFESGEKKKVSNMLVKFYVLVNLTRISIPLIGQIVAVSLLLAIRRVKFIR